MMQPLFQQACNPLTREASQKAYLATALTSEFISAISSLFKMIFSEFELVFVLGAADAFEKHSYQIMLKRR